MWILIEDNRIRIIQSEGFLKIIVEENSDWETYVEEENIIFFSQPQVFLLYRWGFLKSGLQMALI